jgi:hypothetical protein
MLRAALLWVLLGALALVGYEGTIGGEDNGTVSTMEDGTPIPPPPR